MNVLLVGNYPPDRQESMQRFAELLRRELEAQGHTVHLLRPAARLNRGGKGPQGFAKWLGYIDKFLLFPLLLKRHARAADLVHIVDHSNAPYIRALERKPHLVTCNDVLAIRSALGDFPRNPTGWSGKILQRIILKSLNRARFVTCISENTRRELLQVSTLQPSQVTTTYMGQNYPYSPTPACEARKYLAALLGHSPETEQIPAFILHVGGNQWYKNRVGVLKIYAHLRHRRGAGQTPLLIMAGKPFTDEMRHIIEQENLSDAVISLQNTSNEELRALYSLAELLLFPSLAEGFGWPIAEAQACGCRVVTTDAAPMTEVGGEAAVYLAPENHPSAAECVASVLDEDAMARRARIEAGLHHAERFSTRQMIEAYQQLYTRLLAESGD